MHRNVRSGVILAAAATALTLMAVRIARRARRRILRIAVLNPCDGSLYNSMVMTMLQQHFESIGVAVTLCEFDVMSADRHANDQLQTDPSIVDDVQFAGMHFDGFIIPGSAASAYDGEPWIDSLVIAIRRLHESNSPMLGLCFGHQIIAYALGGSVQRGTALQAAASTFTPTTLGRRLLRVSPARLLYHHNDVVTELPSSCGAISLAITEPHGHAAVAYLRTDGSVAALTWQAHLEMGTTCGRYVLARLIERDAERQGEVWARKRLATIESTGWDNAHIMRSACELLWPAHLPSRD